MIKVENNKQESVRVLAFTNKVPELMSISDLVIGHEEKNLSLL